MYAKLNINIFSQVSDTHAYETRHGALLRIPSQKTATFKHSPKYNCVSMYEILPKHMREINYQNDFKKDNYKLSIRKCFL